MTFICMKNLNKRLSEAISRGVNIALDDYEDIDNVQISSKKDIIKNHSAITMRVLIQKFIESKRYKLQREKLYKDILNLVNNEGYTYVPKDRNELINLIDVILKIDFKADLNWIDVSKLTDMSMLFRDTPFNGDISKWDVSNVTCMTEMFCGCKFNGDISKWNVSRVESMDLMFGEHSEFNGDISKWDVSRVEDFTLTFAYSKFTGDISNWNVSSATSMSGMFTNSIFNGDLSKWNVENVNCFAMMFNDSKFNNESIINWNIGEGVDMDAMFANSSLSIASLTKIFKVWAIELKIDHITGYE